MSCPFLKDVVMTYCSAYPVKKMVPKDRMVGSSCACVSDDFQRCPLAREILARLAAASPGAEPRASLEEPLVPLTTKTKEEVK